MKQVSYRLSQIGVDGIIIGVLSLVAIAVALYDLLGGKDVSQPLLVGILALLLLEIVLQRTRLEAAKEEIINQLKGVRVEVFATDREFANARYRQLMATEGLIYDTELCNPRYSPTPESDFRKLLNEMIVNNKVTYKAVSVIYDKGRFEGTLKNLFRFYKYAYYIGYYLAPPELIPILNVMIFDRRHFMLGGYYGPSARGDDRNIYIQHDLIAKTLEQYFDYLWSKARLFNEHKVIKWEEVRYCGLALGYSIDELNATISRIAQKEGFSEIQVLK